MSDKRNDYEETTPLLWPPQQAPFPGQGALNAPGTFPSQYQQNFHPSFQFFNRPQRQPTSKQIQHEGSLGKDPHSQFCALTGCPPTNAPPDFKFRPNEKTLYGRAVTLAHKQNQMYVFTATVTNLLLLLQIILGAALTGLPASHFADWVITLIGAINTVIAGLVGYLKSRGQPVRSRMYRDDLQRIVDQIENSEVMWLGIARDVHGYSDIDTENQVTVRSEVARLTRLLDDAIRINSANVPENYSGAATGREDPNAGIKGPSFGPLAIPSDVSIPGMPAKKKDNVDPTTSVSETSKAAEKKEEEEKKKKEAEDKKKTEPSNKAESSSKAESSQKAESSNNQNSSNTTSTTLTDKGKNVVSSITSNVKQMSESGGPFTLSDH